MRQKFLAVLSLCLVGACASYAGTLGVTVLDSSTSAYLALDASYTIGWNFSTTSPLLVKGLAFWDEGLDGFAPGFSPSVGIYDLASGTPTLLASANVLSSDPLQNVVHIDKYVGDKHVVVNGGFRVHAIPQFILEPGTYQMSGFNGGTEAYLYNTTLQPASGLTVQHGYYGWGASQLGYSPTSPAIGWNAYLGPNFDDDAVPEPGSFALLGAGLLLLVIRRRTRPARV